jgi:hypothetical protein
VEGHQSTSLYRAVGLNEARDIQVIAGFRTNSPRGYEAGKWFATSYEDAERWERAFQRFPHPRPFRIAWVSVNFALLSKLSIMSNGTPSVLPILSAETS